MTTAKTIVFSLTTFLFAGINWSPTIAQEPKERIIEQYACKDIIRESGANRDVAIAFLHGFLLGKSGGTKFNVDVLHKRSADFIERCLDNPNETAIDAMSKVKN
jgi:hypothetical protein